MRRSQFLHHGPQPVLASGSTFAVSEGAVVLTASGLSPGECVPIEVRVQATGGSKPCPAESYTWAPLVNCGCAVALCADNTQQLLMVPGTYRINIAGLANPAAVVIALNEDESTNLKNVTFSYSAPRCCPSPCPDAAPVGVVDTWG